MATGKTTAKGAARSAPANLALKFEKGTELVPVQRAEKQIRESLRRLNVPVLPAMFMRALGLEEVSGYTASMVALAQRGITSEARYALREAVESLRSGEPLDPSLAAFLAEQLERVADSSKLWEAPLVKRKPGDKAKDQTLLQLELAAAVWRNLQPNEKGEIPKMEWAYADAEKALRRGGARAAWRKFGKLLKKMG